MSVKREHQSNWSKPQIGWKNGKTQIKFLQSKFELNLGPQTLVLRIQENSCFG